MFEMKNIFISPSIKGGIEEYAKSIATSWLISEVDKLVIIVLLFSLYIYEIEHCKL